LSFDHHNLDWWWAILFNMGISL